MTDQLAPESLEAADLTALDPRQRNVLRIRALVAGLIPLLMLSAGDYVLTREFGLPGGWAAGTGVLLYLFSIIILPGRRYRRWGYRQGVNMIRIASGLLVRKETVVPYDRVQHIDVSRGPIERAFGVATLTLHTAGSYNSTVDLPGLAHDDANRMRDEIRSHISQDLP